MEKVKVTALDILFCIFIPLIGLLSGLADGFCWRDVETGGFPIFSMFGIFFSAGVWVLYLIYSFVKAETSNKRIKTFRTIMCIVLPILTAILMFLGLVMLLV